MPAHAGVAIATRAPKKQSRSFIFSLHVPIDWLATIAGDASRATGNCTRDDRDRPRPVKSAFLAAPIATETILNLVRSGDVFDALNKAARGEDGPEIATAGWGVRQPA